MNDLLHEGIFNVKYTDIISVENIESSSSYNYGTDSYANVKIYFVKCDMDVYETDKYYQDGINYFLFYIGLDENGDLKIANIEIPSYNVLKTYDTSTKDIEKFQQVRNELIYGIVDPHFVDIPAYIDYVGNPLYIKVEGYADEIPFWEYCTVVAANEINTLTTDNSARAGAMAIKMFSMHFINTAASGANYQINQAAQAYLPGTPISSRAKNAIEYVKNYFLLGDYGENFKTFYYTKYNASSIIGKYSYKNGGVLSHVEANTLGENGMSWQDILRYYYTKVSGTAYIPYAKESKSLIITTAHTHDWSNAYSCPYCGALVY